MQSRVSFRLGAVFGLIVFLTVLASYLSLGHQLQLLLMKSITHELRRELMLNRELLETSMGRKAFLQDPDGWADRIGGILEVRVTVIAPDGRVTGDSYIERNRLSSVENHADRPEVKAALSQVSVKIPGTARPSRNRCSIWQFR